jgi:DnaJ-class molecular chaperone
MVARPARIAAIRDEEKREMPVMDCPNCDGTGQTQDAAGEQIVCPMCEGTGVLFDDEGDPDTNTG